MKIAIKKKIVLGLFSLLAINSWAQQDAMYTHYMYNTLSVNPGYAGTRDALTITGLNRSQWVGFEGAPVTQTLTLHSPIANKKIGLGLSVVNDKIGPVKNTMINADFAYQIKLNSKSKLAFGLKGGISITSIGLSSLETTTSNDISFSSSITSKILPNFGFGVYYYTEKFYAGISTPKILENNLSETNGNLQTSLINEQRHYFFIAGTVFDLSKMLQLKPTTFVKVTSGAPIEADLTAMFIWDKKLNLGAMYRTGDAAGLLLGYNITEQLYVGYSFDWSFVNKTMTYNNGSHELMVRYDFIFHNNKKIKSPRYF
jgi:type IX secretion system PorP/SprF family membrane protein